MMIETEIGKAKVREMAAVAAFQMAIAALRNLVSATDAFTKADCSDDAYPPLRVAWREAVELIHMVDGNQPAGEVPPIPPLDVPPIPPPPAEDDEQGFGGNDWRNRPHRIG